MTLAGKVVIVTGGARGIGRALCRRFAAEGPRGLIVADRDGAGAEAVAAETGGRSVRIDVTSEADVRQLVQTAIRDFGCVDLCCSNAGISITGGVEAGDADWDRIFAVNFRAHLYAARAVLPHMLARGEGYLLQTVSAAGLLTETGSALYSVTKHAALALAEWLAVEYGDRGIRVSCLCPQGVRTDMLMHASEPLAEHLRAGAIEPEAVAEAAVRGLAGERFLILPHPQVEEFFRRKASDYDRWLRGMRRLKARISG